MLIPVDHGKLESSAKPEKQRKKPVHSKSLSGPVVNDFLKNTFLISFSQHE